jgi:hypothetical protein
MIDVQSEAVLSLSEASRAVCPGRPVHLSTLYRWIAPGVRGQRLEAVRVGGRTLTSKEALTRFLSRLNQPGAVPPPPNAAALKAGEKLRRKGA